MVGMTGMPFAGDIVIARALGDGVGIGEPFSEKSSASERGPRAEPDPRDAKAAAVAAAASSTVPVWWFW